MTVKCANASKNKERCNCSYEGCTRNPVCCECLHYHLAKKSLPACCFPPEAEATFDRSFKKFIEVWSARL